MDDPEQAYADPAAVAALGRLAERWRKVVVITGRPIRTRSSAWAASTGVPGLGSMTVLGQYGVERWNAAGDQYTAAAGAAGDRAVADELPELLASLDLAEARIEHKGRAVGVHTRTLTDPGRGLRPARATRSGTLAERYGLRRGAGQERVGDPGAPGWTRVSPCGVVVTETGARQVIFAGDDLGDLPAFGAVLALREEGMPGLLVCSASYEEDALVEISDVILDGTAGVAAWLGALADAIDAAG